MDYRLEVDEMQEPDPSWIEFLQRELNREQFEFATSKEPALLGLAGPGSGKTRALVFRAAHLIKCGVNPGHLLLLTFTNKAAGEMKNRLEGLLGYLPREMWAGTFHSTGSRILRRHAGEVGRTANFTIYDEDDSRSALKQVVNSLDISDEDRKLILQRGLLARIISQSRNSKMTVREVMEEDYPYRLHYLNTVKEISELYEKKKKESNVCDFDDLLLLWMQLFDRNPQIREQYQKRFRHVLVDEFQDTNIIQAGIIDCFYSKSSICVVGDDAQSIYAFRYANIDNIIDFPEKYKQCRLVRMEKNYRSSPEIVELANHLISYNSYQLPKTLFSDNPHGEKPVIASVFDARQEATFVLQSIWELQNNGVPLKEIAVLYRSSYLTPEVEFALARKSIAYRTYGGLKFFQKAHIKDILAYLQVMHNPRDENAWRRIFLLQQGLGQATFGKLWSNLKAYHNPLEAALDEKVAPSRGRAGWEALCETLKSVYSRGLNDVPGLIMNILEQNYDQVLKQNYPDQYEDRFYGIERLAIYAERFENLASFLESLVLEESVFADSSGKEGSPDEQLTLSTIHSAKGKEWDSVFVIGMNQGQFPSRRVGPEGIDEERRLFYVAVTRARRYLFLSTYLENDRNYGVASEGYSQFLRELPSQSYRLVDFCGDF